MKKLAILYNQPLSNIQGINYVNNSFLSGKEFLLHNGIDLTFICGSDFSFDCHNHNSLPILGSAANRNSHNSIRLLIKRIIPRTAFFPSLVNYYLSCHKTAKFALRNYIMTETNADYLIFQDPQTAYYYFRKYGKCNKVKTILLLHCSKDYMEQGSGTFPGVYRNKWAVRKIRKLYEYSISKVDKVVYLSQRAVDYSPVAPEKKTYIFNGEEDLHDHEITEPHNPINITCVGSMAWRKGQDFIIDAMAKLPKDIRKSYKLHLIGSGPQLQELKDLVNKLNLEEYVVFYGNRNDVPELLKQMDMFIMPSISEGLPMSIIEALRQGMYVIGTDTGGIPEMIAPGCGELVDRDADKIAVCLSKVVEEKKITHEMKVKAREHYLKHFTLKSMINNYCDVLHSL